jgi:hypothetical protein
MLGQALDPEGGSSIAAVGGSTRSRILDLFDVVTKANARFQASKCHLCFSLQIKLECHGDGEGTWIDVRRLRPHAFRF